MAMRIAIAIVVTAVSALPAQAQLPYARGQRFAAPRPGIPAIRRPATGNVTVYLPRPAYGPGPGPRSLGGPVFNGPLAPVQQYFTPPAYRTIGPVGRGVAPGTYFYPNRINRLAAQAYQVVGPNRVLVDRYGRRVYQNAPSRPQQQAPYVNGQMAQQMLSSQPPQAKQFVQGQVLGSPVVNGVPQAGAPLLPPATQPSLQPKPDPNPLPPPAPVGQSTSVARPALPVIPASQQSEVPADPPNPGLPKADEETDLPPVDPPKTPEETDLPPVVPPTPGGAE